MRRRGFVYTLTVLTTILATGCATSPARPGDGGSPDAAVAPDGGAGDPDAGAPEARLLVAGRGGELASLSLTSPWTVRASADVGDHLASARCTAGRCVLVHDEIDAIRVIDSTDLHVLATHALERGADPRDVAILDARTAVVSQRGRAELVVIDLVTGAERAIDLAPLADADGIPETNRLAHCGRRVYAQLLRVDRETHVPAEIGAGLAVIDLDRAAGSEIVDADPSTSALDAVALARRPGFDMVIDCAAGTLAISEPMPLMQGGGGYEEVDLDTLAVRELPIVASAEIGGFEIVETDRVWQITHTEIGPGPSSHLSIVIGDVIPDTHNTFSSEHVDELALDREADLLFYPDPCQTIPMNPGCEPGVYVFDAHDGTQLSEAPIDVGFPAYELALAR